MEATFILALFAHGYKVKTTTLYHLLKGKRTSSVLLYGFFYDSLRFIDSQPQLTLERYQKIIDSLVRQQFLTLDALTNEGQLTSLGKKYLATNSFALNKYGFIDYYHYGKNSQEIWRLLQFSVQVISQLSYGNKQYIPLENSPLYQIYLKNWLKAYPRTELITLFQKNWFTVLQQLTDAESDYLAAQFSGYHLIGEVSQQLRSPQLSTLENQLWQVNTWHHLFEVILAGATNQPLIQLIRPFVLKNQNQSMNTTRQLIQEGRTVEEIAAIRKIKQSTVNDHLLELAIRGEIHSFDFVANQPLVNHLCEANHNVLSWRYQSLKEQWPELTYLDFRLIQIGLLHQRGRSL
jgi:uncharacterized protein YpbB